MNNIRVQVSRIRRRARTRPGNAAKVPNRAKKHSSSKSDNSSLVIHLEREIGARAIGRLALDTSRWPIVNGYRDCKCMYIRVYNRSHTETHAAQRPYIILLVGRVAIREKKKIVT